MLSVALIADAVVGNVQEKAMKTHKAVNAEVILYSYGIGAVYLLIFLLLSGNLRSGVVAFGENPLESYGYAFVFSLSGYFGMQVMSSFDVQIAAKDFLISNCVYNFLFCTWMQNGLS